MPAKPENIALWSLVEKTDPAHVTPITGKSYSGSSPRPHWLILKATETFGPCGIGWGFQILDERIEDGSDGDRMSFARVRVWYQWEGKRGEVEHVGGTPFSGKRKNGAFFADEDAPKKSVTDALIKSLSLIGFAGDIFMGRWDDSGYVQQLNAEFRAAAQQDGATRYLDESVKTVAKYKNADELRAWWKKEEVARNAALTKIQAASLLQTCKARIAEIEKQVKNPPQSPLPSLPADGEDVRASDAEGAAVVQRSAAPIPFTADELRALEAKGDGISKHGTHELEEWLERWMSPGEKAAATYVMRKRWRDMAAEREGK